MKSNYLYIFFFAGILLFSKVSYAQELTLQEIISGKKDLSKEEKYLEFQTHFFEALKQKAISNYGKAIESLEQCYLIDSTSLAVEFELSKNYLALKNYFEAEIFINKALEKDPKNVYLLDYKVLIYKQQRNFSEAIKTQKQLIEISPKYTEDLVLLYLQNNEYENAQKLIIEVEKNALSSTKIVGYKNYLESRLTPTDSLTEVGTAPIENTSLSNLKRQYNTNKEYKILQKILIYESENELYEMLFSDSKSGLEVYPSQPFLYHMNGWALNKLAKYNEAIAVLTIGIDFVIENIALEADFYEQLSMSYEGLNNKTEALKYMQKANQLRKNK